MNQQRPRPGWRADRLDVRLRQGRLEPRHVRAVARALASACAADPASPACAAGATSDALAEQAGALAERVAKSLPEAAVRVLHERTERAAAAWSDVLAARIEQGRLAHDAAQRSLAGAYVDAAGDVLLAAPGDGPRRAADAALAVTRIWVGLAAGRHRDLAEALLSAWAEAADDYEIYRVLPVFEGLAALGLAAEALDRDDVDAARRLLAAVDADAPRSRPRIIAVSGPIASGKSTVATRLASEIGAPVISADTTRDALAARGVARPDGWSIYLELIRRAEPVLESGRSVVLDGGFTSQAKCRAAARLARDRGLAFLLTECRAGERTLRRRLAERAERGDFEEAFEDVLAQWEPVGALDGASHVVIDTTQAAPRGFARLYRVLPAPRHQVA